MKIVLALFLLATCFLLVRGQIDYDYGRALGLSIWFYEAQRSGRLPENNRVTWRRDTFLNDGTDVGVDLEGGYFDAGDHIKFAFPLAGTMTILAWGLLDYKDGYVEAGEWNKGLETLKWGLDYMIKTHPEPNVIWTNVADDRVDHGYWGRPEDWPSDLPRPTTGNNITGPASDLAGEYAAAFAAGALVFRDVDINYSSLLFEHALDSYNFATQYLGKYSDYTPTDPYRSWDYKDELLWAAAWMNRLTNGTVFLNDAKKLWDDNYMGYTPGGFGWDDKLAGAQILLAKLTGDPEYTEAATNFCSWIRTNATVTPKGLIWLGEWGSLRSIATVVFACLQAADIGINPIENRALARSQIGYILGNTGRSFVIGFGLNPPERPHHRASSCPDMPAPCEADTAINQPGPNPQVLYGALVGGPDAEDNYQDVRTDYVQNEVALDYNAGFQSALAGILSLQLRGLWV